MKAKWVIAPDQAARYLNGPNGVMVGSTEDGADALAFWPGVNVRVEGEDLVFVEAHGFPASDVQGARKVEMGRGGGVVTTTLETPIGREG